MSLSDDDANALEAHGPGDLVAVALEELPEDFAAECLRLRRRVRETVTSHLVSGSLYFDYAIRDDDDDETYLAPLSRFLNLVATLLPAIDMDELVSISSYTVEDPPPVIDSNALDAFFQALAKKRQVKTLFLLHMKREELCSFTEQFSRHRRQKLDCLLLGIVGDLEGNVGRLVRFSFPRNSYLACCMAEDRPTSSSISQQFLQTFIGNWRKNRWKMMKQ
jgi:hypothetical protein